MFRTLIEIARMGDASGLPRAAEADDAATYAAINGPPGPTYIRITEGVDVMAHIRALLVDTGGRIGFAQVLRAACEARSPCTAVAVIDNLTDAETMLAVPDVLCNVLGPRGGPVEPALPAAPCTCFADDGGVDGDAARRSCLAARVELNLVDIGPGTETGGGDPDPAAAAAPSVKAAAAAAAATENAAPPPATTKAPNAAPTATATANQAANRTAAPPPPPTRSGLVSAMLTRAASCQAIVHRIDDIFAAAASGGDPSVVGLLLRVCGARLDAKKGIQEAFEQAAAAGHMEVASIFLDHFRVERHTASGTSSPFGSSADAPRPALRGENGMRVLRTAAANGRLAMVRLLLSVREIGSSHVAHTSSLALSAAVRNGHLDVVEVLLEHRGTDPTFDDCQALRWAALRGFEQIVRLLLALTGERAVDPRALDDECIRFAALNGHLGVVCALLADGRCDPAALDNYAIRAAARLGHLEIVHALLREPRVNPGAQQSAALRVAAAGGHAGVVEALLAVPEEHRAVDPGACDHEAMRSALRLGATDIVRALILIPTAHRAIAPGPHPGFSITRVDDMVIVHPDCENSTDDRSDDSEDGDHERPSLRRVVVHNVSSGSSGSLSSNARTVNDADDWGEPWSPQSPPLAS
jgi:ankyrin repeat protein